MRSVQVIIQQRFAGFRLMQAYNWESFLKNNRVRFVNGGQLLKFYPFAAKAERRGGIQGSVDIPGIVGKQVLQ